MAALALAGTCVTPAYAAEAPHVEAMLRYHRDPGAEACPSEPDLRAAVAARVGYDPFVTKDGLEIIAVRVQRKGTRLEATIARTSNGSNRGRPTILASDGADCVELGASMAVAIAIAIDPLSMVRAEPVGPTAPERTERPTVLVAPAPPPSEPPKEVVKTAVVEPAPPTQLVVAAGPAMATGALPAASLGVRAGLESRGGRRTGAAPADPARDRRRTHLVDSCEACCSKIADAVKKSSCEQVLGMSAKSDPFCNAVYPQYANDCK